MVTIAVWASLALAGPLQDCKRASAEQCEVVAQGLADPAVAAELRELACLRKHAPSCRELAGQLREGRGVPVDKDRALSLSTRACELGDGEGCASAAETRRRQWDLREARQLAARGCTQGSARACNLEGVMLERGEDLYDLAQAASRYQAACDARYPEGCYHLARLVFYGLGVPADPQRAHTLQRQACDMEHGQACLGEAGWLTLYAQRDPEEALRFSERACALGVDNGCVDLAWGLLHGQGAAPDPERARGLLEEACTRGSSRACTELARVLTEGLTGPPDPEGALARLAAACTAKVSGACWGLAEGALEDGRFDRAAQALRQACELGDRAACSLTAHPNPVEIACRAGAPQACLRWAQVQGDPRLARQLRAAACGTEPSCEPEPEIEPVTHAPALEPWRGCFERGVSELGSLALRGRGGPRDEATTEAVRAVFGRAGMELRSHPFEAPLRKRWTRAPLWVGREEITAAPFLSSGDGEVEGKIVKVYPEHLSDPQIRPDLRGKVALLPDSDSVYSHAWLAWNAGAAAVLAPTSFLPSWPGDEAQIDVGHASYSLPVPVLGIPSGSVLRKGARARISVHLTDVQQPYENLLGEIPGRGPLANEIVVLGAHYDHLGLDRWGGVYPGADDNASGVAALACAVETLRAELEEEPSVRTVVVALFDAEELGALGSISLLQRGEIPMDSIHAMVNLDMVGRLRDRPLALRGLGHPGLAEAAARASAETELPVAPDGLDRGGSDDITFRLSGAPALMLHTGDHPEYHTPRDEVSLLDLDGGARIARFAARVAADLATGAPLEEGQGCSGEGTAPLGAVLGWSDLVVRCVDPGSTAEALGLRPGDRIAGVGPWKVSNPYDLHLAMELLWPHAETVFLVDRQGSLTELSLFR